MKHGDGGAASYYICRHRTPETFSKSQVDTLIKHEDEAQPPSPRFAFEANSVAKFAMLCYNGLERWLCNATMANIYGLLLF